MKVPTGTRLDTSIGMRPDSQAGGGLWSGAPSPAVRYLVPTASIARARDVQRRDTTHQCQPTRQQSPC